MLNLHASIYEMWKRTYAIWKTKARKGVKETIEIMSVNTILFNYRRCSIWPPSTSIHFVYCLIISWQKLGKIPGISDMNPAATCIRATRSSCVSTWMTALATDWLDVEALTWPDTIGFPFLWVHGNPGVRDSCGDTKSSGTAGVIRDMPGIFPRVRHKIIRQYTKYIEVPAGHIEHLL